MSSKKYHSDQDTDQTSPKRCVKAYYAPLTDLNPYVAECRPTDAEPAEPMPEHKIVVELAGQWPSNSATLRLGKTAEQSVKIAKPAQDPEAGHRSLAVFEGLMEEPRNLYLSLSRENVSEPLDLLLAKALEPVEKGTKKEEWDNVLVPIRALVYLGDTQDKAHVADLKGGYLYIFWKGKVWRELEITSEGYYRDIDITYYRSRAGYSDAHEVRKADGFSLPQFWVPYKIQGDYQQSAEGVKILFSPTQMTIPQLDELEQKTDSLAQISSTLDELSVYSKTQGFEVHDQVAAIDSAEVASEHLSSKKSWLDGQARVLKKLHDSKTAVVYLKEPLADSPKFEYAVELACTEETFNALKLDEAIVVAPTAAETETEVLQPTISQDALIFVSRLRVNETKTVQVKSGQVALSTSIDGVMPDPIESHAAKDGFIPVQLAVEVGHRLALPTIGYYYHFMADALLHEYKITGDEENWHYQATKSNAESLTDDVLDDRELNAVILPWKIQNEPAKRQHLLYSPHKLTLNDLKQMDGEWLDEHATLLDLDAMMAAGKQAQAEAVQYQREGQLYTIQKGDTLTTIAKAHGITLDVVLTLNPDYQVGDRQDHIYPGETLILPVDESHEAQEITSTHIDYMTVKQDASVDEVAALAGLDTATLLAYNPYLQSLDPTDVVMAEDVVIVNKTESQTPDTRTHEVKAIHDALGHESLSSIAALYDQTPQKLAEINGLDLSDPQFTLQVGQVLKIDPPHPQAEGVQRNTYPAVLVEDYNLAENMVYHYAQPKISAQFAPIHHASVLAPKATVVRVASLTTAADIQTIKLCLGRYALDEVDAPYNQALVLEQKQGKHPIDAALSEKYAVKPHPLAKETAHSLTIRQIREGYVYVYYAAVNSHVAARYPHAGELHEFRYADGLFEYNDETTPYLPCHSLNGWAYIVFSEREWTEKQRNQFQQDPEFRRALAKNTGAVYDFNQRLVSAKGEEEVFTDLPVLVADIDAGPANQDHRFADTTTPTHQSDTENRPGTNDQETNAEKEHFTPVLSNQAYLDTIDPETPHHADILILEDGIALAEDSLKLTILANDLRIQWQEKNLPELNLAKAVGDFCNLNLLPEDPLAKELEDNELLKAKFVKRMNLQDFSMFAYISSGSNDAKVSEIEQNMRKQGADVTASYFDLLAEYANELGLKTKEPLGNNKKEYVKRYQEISKWRSRVNVYDVNEVIVKHTASKVAYDSWVQYVSKCSLISVNQLGITPDYLSFDLRSNEQSTEFVLFVTKFQFGLEHTLQGSELIQHKNQFHPGQPLINIIGSMFYQGSQFLKDELENYVKLLTENGPNDVFNYLSEMGFNQEQLVHLIEESHQWHLQGSRADQSALTVGVVSLFGAFKVESFENWNWYKDNILSKYLNIKKVFVKHAGSLINQQVLFSVNRLIQKSLSEELRLSAGVIDTTPEMKWGTRWISSLISNQIANGDIYLSKGMRDELEKLRDMEFRSTYWLILMEEIGAGNATLEDIKAQREKVLNIREKISDIFYFENKKVKRIFKAFIINQAEKFYDAVESFGSRTLNLTITNLNFLALIEDVNNISKKHNKDEKDELTIKYRVAYLIDSILSMNKSTYLAEAREMLAGLKRAPFQEDVYDSLKSKNLFSTTKGMHALDAEKQFILRRAIMVGLGANLALVLAGGFETYQIVMYDFSKSKGTASVVNAFKALSTITFAATGALEVAALAGIAVPLWLLAGPALVAGVVYAICTAYLNFIREDDVTDWLVKTPWVDLSEYGDEKTVKEYSLNGYRKAFDALTRLKNKPTVYYQPTLANRYKDLPMPYNHQMSDSLYGVNGYWIMVDFPYELKEKVVRIEALWYSKNNSEVNYVQVGNEAVYYPEWVRNKRPFSPVKVGMAPRLPATPKDKLNYINTWPDTGQMNLIHRFWLPRPYGNKMDSLLLFVWYPDDLITREQPQSQVSPHCFDMQKLPGTFDATDINAHGMKTDITIVESAFGEVLNDLRSSSPYYKLMRFGANEKTSLLTVGYI